MKNRLKVLHLIKGLGRGGAEVLLAEGLRVANRACFDFSYGYFLPWKDALEPSLAAMDAHVECFHSRSNIAILASAGRLARYLRKQKIDLIHAHLPVSGFVARLAGRKAGIPVVYTEHNLQERYHWATRTLNRLSWELQDEAIAVSKDVLRSIESNIGGRVHAQTILNGVNTKHFDGEKLAFRKSRSDFGIPSAAPVVGTVAVFRIQKRLLDWIDVASRVRSQIPTCHFLLVGDGPERKAIEDRVEQLGLQNCVHLVGFREEARPFLSAMDVFLMTSEFEGLPIAMLEAMAMRVPVVATMVGGIPEVVKSSENGLLYRCGDIEGLASGIIELLSSQERIERMSQAGRATVVSGFSMERMQSELEEVYLRVVERYRAGD